ncbi:MAG: winged helix-turn-helix domain-containing protein [Actinomycetota bacterium]|nr:winged helix-turn-helix domain-containing protein [Actinomycetota bacterium]
MSGRGRVLIEFRLLGQVEAWRDGSRLELGGRKQRAVLTALLVRAGRVVSLDQLIDDLWPGNPPARAAATVQVFVSNLRRALAPDRPRGAPAQLLVTSAPGYVLRAEPGAIDAHEFVRLAEEGRLALDDDDSERTAELLRRAAELWRGAALADVRDAPFAQAEAARLEELRLSGAEDRVDAELSLGRHTAVVTELEQRVNRHPMRERTRAQPDLAWERPEPVIRSEPASVSSDEPGTEPGRVLVVGDSGVNRRLLVRALTELGHEALAAEHGRRATRPARTGAAARRRFQRRVRRRAARLADAGDGRLVHLGGDQGGPRLNHLPVIMVSAVHELESVARCIDLGATDYLPKPFSAAVLRARLRSSLAAKRLRDVERDCSSRENVRCVRTRVFRRED